MNGKNNEKGAKNASHGDSTLKKTPEKGKNTVKPYNEVHESNKYDDAIKATHDTTLYDKAEQALRQRTYREKVKIWYYTILSFRVIYPIASLVLGCFAVYQFLHDSMNGETDLGFWFFLAILCLIASAIEVGKSYFSSEFFYEGAKSKIIGIVLLTGISIALSSYGMYELTMKQVDNSAEITQDFTQKTDSIRSQYMDMITVYDEQIHSAKDVLSKKGNKWLKHSARENLANAQSEKAKLLALIKSESTELDTKKEREIKSDFDKNDQNAMILAFLIFLCEVIYIASISTIVSIHRKLKTENRTFKFSKFIDDLVARPTNNSNTMNGMQLLTIDGMQYINQYGNLIPVQPYAPNQITMESNTVNSSTVKRDTINGNTVKRVGFQVGHSGDGHTVDSKLKSEKNRTTMDYTHDSTFMGYASNGNPKFKQGELRKCDNCGKEYRITHWSKRFCCDECKYKHHGFDLEKYKIAKYGK